MNEVQTYALRALHGGRSRVAIGWTQCENAKDEWGTGIPESDEEAVCWCAYGAIRAEFAPDEEGMLDDLECDTLDLVCQVFCDANSIERMGKEYLDGDLMMYWNDRPERTQAQVIEAFDTAITTFTETYT